MANGYESGVNKGSISDILQLLEGYSSGHEEQRNRIGLSQANLSQLINSAQTPGQIANAKKALKKESSREKALRKTGQRKQVGLTDFQAAYKTADKANKKVFTHKGKKYTTLKKGEKPDKIMPELSGKTSKKIKKFIG